MSDRAFYGYTIRRMSFGHTIGIHHGYMRRPRWWERLEHCYIATRYYDNAKSKKGKDYCGRRK